MTPIDLKPGIHISGAIPGQSVEVVAATPVGNAVNLVYQKLDGGYDSVMLFPEDLVNIRLTEGGDHRTFGGDANGFLLAAEALRIQYSYVFDTRLAMHTSIIQPLPHQITAVYEDMLPRQPLRFLLADDPGAGKTIMAGLLIKELMIRGEVERCLIVCPGSLAQQWVEDELVPKFGVEFRILTNDLIDSTKSGNPFNDVPLLVASVDKLARDERVQGMLAESSWDLVIVDEAHKMAAHVNGRKINYTKRYRLGQVLSARTRNMLLLTATPHNGKEGDFQEFMKLLDPDLFEGGARDGTPVDLSTLMRRLQKEELLTFEGKPLFPIREARTVQVELTAAERSLYEDVTAYVREGFNRAERFVAKDKRNAVGFAMTSLQRRLASSPLAAYRSLSRRRKRLEERAAEVRDHGTYTMKGAAIPDQEGWAWDDWDDDDREAAQDTPEGILVLDSATAAETLEELEAEIVELEGLETEARRVLNSREDRKWRALLELLESDAMRAPDGTREKLIIFTEFTDTMEYLEGRLSDYLGAHERLRTIRGGMNRDERRTVEAEFKQDPEVSVLVATDAAGEGINLQVAHLLINYDLPWNPNRIEQRFGRIHRIGQHHTCLMYNVVADGTREGEVWKRLFDKLEQEKETLQGKVFDILGQVTYDDKSLSDLLLEAVRADQTPERQAYLDTVVDKALDHERLKALMARDVLATDALDIEDVTRVRTDIERANAMRLQPHYIRSFFQRALENLGGRLVPKGDGTYRIRRVPLALAVKSSNGARRPLATKYDSLAFDKEHVADPGRTDLVCVGHPLLDAAVEETLAKHSAVLSEGAVLVDDANRTIMPRLMMAYSLSICDGEGRDVQRRLYYVEAEAAGEASIYRQAPYIDYRPPTPEELAAYDEDLVWDCIGSAEDMERQAEALIMDELVAPDVARIVSERNSSLERIARAVEKRLDHAIVRASREAQEWAVKVQRGNENARLTARNKKAAVEELARRKEVRLAELESQRTIRPKPLKLVACALVLPSSFFDSDEGERAQLDLEARKASELRGMNAVMAIERFLGHAPVDVSRENVGWDVESSVTDSEDGTESLLFIESKGVRADADTVTLTANEVLKAAGNRDRFVLAITRPREGGTETTYLRGSIQDDYNKALDCYPMKIAELVARAEDIQTYDIKDGTCTRRS